MDRPQAWLGARESFAVTCGPLLCAIVGLEGAEATWDGLMPVVRVSATLRCQIRAGTRPRVSRDDLPQSSGDSIDTSPSAALLIDDVLNAAMTNYLVWRKHWVSKEGSDLEMRKRNALNAASCPRTVIQARAQSSSTGEILVAYGTWPLCILENAARIDHTIAVCHRNNKTMLSDAPSSP
ncbi:hypothetical protein PsorP6_014319 [Peronosclerospora sorghi]|uniref:Uncharacterized protein n=1 Tax=Peronosclerospora sorghi TaxID=230839 RepID=A0ACC0VJ57_9STRA|nr:hypothetical protein PsorP6_014319 [Peronosclerospora sorghi]